MEITLKLLNSFLNNILKFNDCDQIKDNPEEIVSAVTSLVEASDYWHIQRTEDGKAIILWRKKAWLAAEEYKKVQREKSEAYNAVLDERKQEFKKLCRQICYTLEISEDEVDSLVVIRMAEKIFKSRSKAAETLFNVNLTNIPELPNKHVVLDCDTGKKLYEL